MFVPSLPAAVLTALTAAVVFLLVLGVGSAARRAGLARRGWWACGALGLWGWLAVTAGLAAAGVPADSAARPPRVPLLAATSVGLLLLAGRAGGGRHFLAAVPLWQPVALQTFRVGVEYIFWTLSRDGAAPVRVTVEGRNFDILAGLDGPAGRGRLGCRPLRPAGARRLKSVRPGRARHGRRRSDDLSPWAASSGGAGRAVRRRRRLAGRQRPGVARAARGVPAHRFHTAVTRPARRISG